MCLFKIDTIGMHTEEFTDAQHIVDLCEKHQDLAEFFRPGGDYEDSLLNMLEPYDGPPPTLEQKLKFLVEEVNLIYERDVKRKRTPESTLSYLKKIVCKLADEFEVV